MTGPVEKVTEAIRQGICGKCRRPAVGGITPGDCESRGCYWDAATPVEQAQAAIEAMQGGHVSISAAALVALHDALVDGDANEAFHILRMQADPDCRVFLTKRDHFAQWKEIAAFSPPLVLA